MPISKRIKIKNLRRSRGISQAKLAEKSGLSQAAISMIEKGMKSPTLTTLEKIAQALGVSVSDLLEDDEKLLSLNMA